MFLISIKKRSDFLALSKSNISKSNIHFHSKTSLILAGKTAQKYLINPHTKNVDSFCRFGLTVSKKVGNAIIRNKTKRRLREALNYLIKEENFSSNFINHFDYVIIAKTSIANGSFLNIVEDLKFCLKHINRLNQENAKKE